MVDSSTFITDIFSEIHTILNDNVQSFTDATSNSVSLRKSSGTGNYWYGAFPDIDIEDSSEYPIGIIRTPNFTEEITTYQQKDQTITVEIAAFGVRADHPPHIIQKAKDQLRSNESSLEDAGLRSLTFGQSTVDHHLRENLKVHEMNVPVQLMFTEC